MAVHAGPRGAVRSIGPVPTTWVIVAVAVSVGLALGLRDARVYLNDDAAITFRYAWRIAHGHGFTYNDGDRTNGASAPLYTLALAGLNALGIDLETAARALGAVCYAAVLGLVAWLGQRFAGLACAVAAPLLLLCSTDFRSQSLSGMESGFAVLLGLVVLVLVVEEQETAAGIVLGLAVVNKLDAGLLALALAGASVVVARRFPWRLALAAAAAATPWLLFATAYFGSPLPYSASQKLTVIKNPAYDWDPWWLLRTIAGDRALGLLVAAVALVVLVLRRPTTTAADTGQVALVSWAALHLAVFSLVDLGDSYGWYGTVLHAPIAVAGAVVLVRSHRLAVARPRGRRPALAAWCLGLLLVVVPKAGHVTALASVVTSGHRQDASERFEATRWAAGRHLGAVAAPGEVIRTCFGWIAYGAPTNPVEETCPLSSRRPVPAATWEVELVGPDQPPWTGPPGAVVEASFSTGGARPEGVIVYRVDS